MDTYWLLSASANQGTFDESEVAYSAEEGPAFMKDIVDMTNNFGSTPNGDMFSHFYMQFDLRAILSFTPGPKGEICPLGGMFTPSFTPRGEHTLLNTEWRG
jgi:hypothetical protein